MAVVGEGEGVDDRVVVDYCYRDDQSDSDCGDDLEDFRHRRKCAWWDEKSKEGGDEEWEREECHEGPEVEELREVNCRNVVAFVAENYTTVPEDEVAE